MINRLTNALLPAIAVLILAGCGSGDNQSAQAPSDDPDATTNNNTSESAPTNANEDDPDATANGEQGIPRQIDPVTEPALSLKDVMLVQINAVRARGATCGEESFGAAGPVQWDVNIESAAALHNAYMRAEERFSHIGQDGSTPSQRLTDSGFEWQLMGENIAAGYPTVGEVVAGWMNSTGHCRNIMNPLFDTIGADKTDGYETSEFINYWTLVLAAKSPAS